MTGPRFSTAAPGERDPNEGATLEEAETLVGMLQLMGKSPSGASTQLLLALATILLDTWPTDEDRLRVVDDMPRLMRRLIDHVREDRRNAADA